MLSIAITSQKGGVGKTTVSVNLAYSFAKRGWKTLLLDTDPQGSVGLSLSKKSKERKGFYDIMLDRSDFQESVLETKMPKLSVLTAGNKTSAINFNHRSDISGEKLENLFSKIEGDGYQLLLVDTAAGIFGPTEAVLRKVDFVLIPQQAEPLGLRSISIVLSMISKLRSEGARAKLLGIVLTMVQDDLLESRGVVDEIKGILNKKLQIAVAIPRNSIFLKASGLGIPVALASKENSDISDLFEKLVLEIENKMGLKKTEGKNEFDLLMD